MTTVYFIRHAESDASVRDGRIRPLTEKGLADRKLVTDFLHDKNIDVVLSSPFKRAIDTVADFADKNNLKIETIEDFRERKSDSDWNREHDYDTLNKRQWDNFAYTLSDGECIAEVQERNIAALNEVLLKYKNKTIVIGTHGMALSTIINYYDKSYGFDDFMAMLLITPWIVRMDFVESDCPIPMGMEKINLFNPIIKPDVEKCIVRTAGLGTLKAYKYTVIFARYKDKWLYCRAKERDTFETAGGRIEKGETILDAAKRELYEETGAVKYDIIPVFDYAVHYPNVYANGQVFLAHVHELENMPNYEMAEVKLFDTIPDKMRFPHILPVLFNYVKSTSR